MHVCGLSQFRQQVKLLFSQSKSDLGQTQFGIEKSKQTHQTWARRLKKIWWKWGLPHSPTLQQANGLVESVRRCTYTASRSFNNKSRPVNSWLNPNYWGLIEHSGSVMGLKWIFHFLHLQHINYANISRLGSNLYLGLYAAFDSVFYCP